MSERFAADFSRQYRLGVSATTLLGFVLTAAWSYVVGFDLVTAGLWTLAVTLVAVWQRWVILGVAYEVGHERLTIARGPYRRHVPWSEIEGVRHAHHRRHGVGGFVLERRGGRQIAITPRHGARFTRVLAERAPHVRFALEPGDSDGASVPPVGVDHVA